MDSSASLSSAWWGTPAFLAVRHCSTFVSQWLCDPLVVRRQENSLGSLTRHKYLPLCPELLGLYAGLRRKDYHMNGSEFAGSMCNSVISVPVIVLKFLQKCQQYRGHNKQLKGKNHLKPVSKCHGCRMSPKILFCFHFPAEGRGH